MYLTQALHRALRQTPTAPATIFGERVRTYSEHADPLARLAGIRRELGDAHCQAESLRELGEILRVLGRLDQARASWGRVEAIARSCTASRL